ncbi:MAG TPA: hypothetical protein DD706_06485, partial [Nitrospiraceae bacterium]|nr:hypothetical protein [Nitrospiraceae bacterium]
MQKSIVQLILIGISVLTVVACADLSRQIPQGEESTRKPSHRPQQLQDLAGIWVYEDETGSNTIMLNEEGDGPYEWEGGWFETHELQEGVWKGRGLQTGNDREGG